MSTSGEAECFLFKNVISDLPGGLVVKNQPADAEDAHSIPAPGRFHMPRGN